jgi:hypothetical protein
MILLNLLIQICSNPKNRPEKRRVQFRATVDQYMNNEVRLNETHAVILRLGGENVDSSGRGYSSRVWR